MTLLAKLLSRTIEKISGGFVLYECSADFPQRIPSVLAAEGLATTLGGKQMPKISEGQKPFSYSISDGSCRLDLIGSEEEGTQLFYLWDSSGSNPKNLAKAFHERVTSCLLKEGVRVWHEKN